MIMMPEVTKENVSKYIVEIKEVIARGESKPLKVYFQEFTPCIDKTVAELKRIACAVLDNPTEKCTVIIKSLYPDLKMTEIDAKFYYKFFPDDAEQKIEGIILGEAQSIISDLAETCFGEGYKFHFRTLRFIAYCLASKPEWEALEIIRKAIYMKYTGLGGGDPTSWKEVIENDTPAGLISYSHYEANAKDNTKYLNELEKKFDATKAELDPCPLCGSKANLFYSKTEKLWKINCTNKKCNLSKNPWFIYGHQAVAWWNNLKHDYGEEGLAETRRMIEELERIRKASIESDKTQEQSE